MTALPARNVARDSTIASEERDERLYQAVLAYQAGEYGKAEIEARRLLDETPQFFPAVLLLGMTLGKIGQADEAIERLRGAVTLDRRSTIARNELASLLQAMGRFDEAVVEAKHAVRLEPEDPGSHNILGLCYLLAGRLPLAITHFKQAIARKLDAPIFHHNLGLAFEQQSLDRDAIAAFRRALALDDSNAESWAHLGRLLYQHGEPAEAANCYHRGAVLQKDIILAAIYRAEALTQQGRIEEAEHRLREALVAEPRSDLGYHVLGVLLQRRGRFDEAIEALERAAELQPKRIWAYVSLVLGKKVADADRWLVERMLSIADDPLLTPYERSKLLYALGKAYDDLGEYETAIRQVDWAHQIEAEQMRRVGRSFDRRAHKTAIDKNIACFSEEFLVRNPAASMSDLPVLIVGMPRSGTTLVEQILSSHPLIGGAGELSFWTDRMGLAGRVLAGSLPLDELRQTAEEYLVLLDGTAPDSARVTDKMPANFMQLGLIYLAMPNARIIHCRRNVIDTCLSVWFTAFGNPLDFAHDRADLVYYCEQYLRLMAHWRRVIPPHQLLEIDYETLVAEPEGVSREMVAFCGLDWDDACLRHEENKHVILTPSVWQARQPVYRDAVARWRRYEPWLGEFRRLVDGASD